MLCLPHQRHFALAIGDGFMTLEIKFEMYGLLETTDSTEYDLNYGNALYSLWGNPVQIVEFEGL
jgi:hypothetical protein